MTGDVEMLNRFVAIWEDRLTLHPNEWNEAWERQWREAHPSLTSSSPPFNSNTTSSSSSSPSLSSVCLHSHSTASTLPAYFGLGGPARAPLFTCVPFEGIDAHCQRSIFERLAENHSFRSAFPEIKGDVGILSDLMWRFEGGVNYRLEVSKREYVVRVVANGHKGREEEKEAVEREMERENEGRRRGREREGGYELWRRLKPIVNTEVVKFLKSCEE
jgi:hypothetical protein